MSLHFLAAIVGRAHRRGGHGPAGRAGACGHPTLPSSPGRSRCSGSPWRWARRRSASRSASGRSRSGPWRSAPRSLAPLALALGLAELAGKSIITRFAARLLLTALAIVSLVIFATDPLSDADVQQGLAGDRGLLPDRPQQAARVRAGPGRRHRRAVAIGFTAARPGRDPAWRDALPVTARPGSRRCCSRCPASSTLLGLNVPVASLFMPLCVLAAVGDLVRRASGSAACGSTSCARSCRGDGTAGDGVGVAALLGRRARATGDFGPVAADDEFGIYRTTAPASSATTSTTAAPPATTRSSPPTPAARLPRSSGTATRTRPGTWTTDRCTGTKRAIRMKPGTPATRGTRMRDRAG